MNQTSNHFHPRQLPRPTRPHHRIGPGLELLFQTRRLAPRDSIACHLLLLIALLYLISLLITNTHATPTPNPLTNFTSILFVVRESHDDWFHPTHEHGQIGIGSTPELSTPIRGPAHHPTTAALCQLDLTTGYRNFLAQWSPGDIQGWDIDHTAQRCILSVRQGGPDNPYHLVELDLDNPTAWRQLTHGPHDDIDPVYLPDGQIAFASNRSRQWTGNGDFRLFNIHLCARDGSAIRPYSTHLASQRTPTVLPDGRLLFIEWAQPEAPDASGFRLLAGHPDGTQYEAVTGLGPWQQLNLAQPRAIPGTSQLLAIASPAGALTRDKGWLVLLDLQFGPDSLQGLSFLGPTPDRWQPADLSPTNPAEPLVRLRVEHPEFSWRHPFPISANAFLATADHEICLVDSQGHQTLLHRETDLPGELAGARPLLPRPREPRLIAAMHYLKHSAVLTVTDVNHGLPQSSPTAASVLIMEELPRPLPNTDGIPEPLLHSGRPILHRLHGTVPVALDGSVSIQVPPLRPLVLALLDASGETIRRMQHGLSLMPGEHRACTGCHEPRTEPPRTTPTETILALRSPPRKPTLPNPAQPVLSHVTHIQPLLNRHCLECHSPSPSPRQILLSPDRTPLFSVSYATLAEHGQLAAPALPPATPSPETFQPIPTLLQRFAGLHHAPPASPAELQLISHWLATGAPFAPTYSVTHHQDIWYSSVPETRRIPLCDPDVLTRRCTPCHHPADLTAGDQPLDHWPFGGRHAQRSGGNDRFINLDQPDLSPLLLAPLAPEAGGWGLCRSEIVAQPAPVFTSTHDPDWTTLRQSLHAAAGYLNLAGRFDLPDFTPPGAYLHWLQRCKIIASSISSTLTPPDLARLDSAYWNLFGQFYLLYSAD